MNISPEDFKEKILSGYSFPRDGDTIIVKGYLGLYGCTSLTHLPKGLVVRGPLDLEGCTSLKHLPKGLVVKGYLDLRDCTELKSIPYDLSVGGIIYCDKALINSIPKQDLPLYINLPWEKELYEYLRTRLQGETP